MFDEDWVDLALILFYIVEEETIESLWSRMECLVGLCF